MTNPFYDPKKLIVSRTGEQAYKDYLARMKNEKNKPAIKVKKIKPIPVQSAHGLNLDDYMILETADSRNNKIELYVAKNKDFFGKNWYQAHEALAKESYQMLTIRQGIDLIKMLKSGKVYDGLKAKLNDIEIAQLLNEIIEVRNPWRAEWLDGRFIKKNDEWYLSQEHKYDAKKSGKLEDKITAKNSIKVNPIIKNFKFNINDTDQYGLPTKEGKGIYYWFPTSGSVARFDAGSYRSDLYCDRDPAYSGAGLGVRRAKILR